MDENDLNYLIVGPWHHGGWSFDRLGDRLGAVDFGSNTSEMFRNEVQGPWFAYWLKDKGEIDFPEARVFRTGANVWEDYDAWPPVENIERRNLYLQSDGQLTFEPPVDSAEEGRDDYISDPDNPVPYRPRPITYNGWAEWQLYDQRFADGPPGCAELCVRTFERRPDFQRRPVAHLFAATTGEDADWIVN